MVLQSPGLGFGASGLRRSDGGSGLFRIFPVDFGLILGLRVCLRCRLQGIGPASGCWGLLLPGFRLGLAFRLLGLDI